MNGLKFRRGQFKQVVQPEKSAMEIAHLEGEHTDGGGHDCPMCEDCNHEDSENGICCECGGEVEWMKGRDL